MTNTTTRPAVGTTYRTGEISPVNAQYLCTKCLGKGGRHVITVTQGATFPQCDHCREDVTWRLENYA